MSSPDPGRGAGLPGATPGPWRVLGDGVTVAQDRRSNRTHVCRAFEIYGVRAEREANAQLLAAAPALLAALQGMVDLFDDTCCVADLHEITRPLAAARQAIAKAAPSASSDEGGRDA